MKREDLFEKILNNTKEKLGDEYEITLREVVKNNHVVLNGMVIMNSNMNISPTIYLDSFWEAYRAGMRLEDIVEKIVEIYRRETPKNSIEIEFFKNFELVKDRICYKLINAGENEELLKDMPSVRYLDLAICFYYSYQNDELGEGIIMIKNSHMEMWHTNVDELMNLAGKNTPILFPSECTPMKDIIAEMDENPGEFLEEMPMHVLSNTKQVNGAISILYPGLLSELAEKAGCNFYILPSSVHEVILLSDIGMDDANDLKCMIRDVNETQVEPEEILSDSLYYFNRLNSNITIL